MRRKKWAEVSSLRKSKRNSRSLYAKAGISADRFSVTFNTDSSFVCQLKNRSIGGTFSVDGETGQISLKYGAVEGLAGAGSLNLYVRKTGRPYSAAFQG